MTTSTRRLLVAAASLTLAATACTATEPADRAATLNTWRLVALPADTSPSTLAVVGDDLLIGGYIGSGAERAPALVRAATTASDPTFVPVRLTPTTPYGKVAELVSVSGEPDALVALGTARGGAHANPRWTVWTGSSEHLIDRPQTFETFGGQEAGGLFGVADDGRGPLIIGSWQGAHGLDGTIWRPAGERWQRQPTIPALANTAELQVAPSTVQQQPDGSVTVSGSVIDLRDGVDQAAAYWRDVDGSWTRTVLADAGARSEAWSTACTPGCWSVGVSDETVAVWSDRAREPVPAVAVDDADRGAVALSVDRVIAAFSSRGLGRLLVGHENSWRLYRAPDGPVRSAALVGSRLYLVVGADSAVRAWSLDLDELG